MAHGQGVTVIPQNALLTTQEAAELLGISRPTLVRLLEDHEIPFEQRGRHRRVMLADLLAYQVSMRRERREALDRMAQEGQAAGLYEATAGPPVRTRLSSPTARFPAFLDTCTLYGAYLCDSLLRLAEAVPHRRDAPGLPRRRGHGEMTFGRATALPGTTPDAGSGV
jgi:excisionase family DNA binding protein